MTVEFSPPPSQPKTASRNEVSASRPTPKTAADTSSANGFSNLLGSIGDGANADPEDQTATGDKKSKSAAMLQASGQPDSQANQPLQFTQTFQLDSGKPRSVLAGVADDKRLNALAASQTLLSDLSAAATASSVGQALPGKGEPGATPAPRMEPAGIADEKYQKSLVANGVVTTNREASEILLAADMSKQFSRSQVAARTVAKTGTDDAIQAQVATAFRDVRDVSRKPPAVDFSPIGFVSPEVVVAAAATGVEKSPVERLAERRQIADGPAGAWGGDVIGGGNRRDTVDAGNSSSFSTELSVAEQVTYWVTQDVQTAELKLDGLGHEPVEVSISLRGNEAHVDFRAEQAETRHVLEGAVAELKELLRGEGLVLSGVSVGSSGQNGSNPQDRRDRQGGRQASVSSPELISVDASQSLPRHSGRAIDLFV